MSDKPALWEDLRVPGFFLARYNNMTADLFDDAFHVTYPSWLLVKKDCVATKGGVTHFTRHPDWLFLTPQEGTSAIPVFTDEDTALRCCVASGRLDEITMIAAEDAQHLADFLQLVEGMNGVREVVFDPARPNGATSRVWPIGYAIERIRVESGLA